MPTHADTGRPLLLHATALAVDGRAALLFGAPGAGKSDLALRCLMQPWRLSGRPVGFDLVSDDQVLVTVDGDGLACHAHDTIAGKIEVRGLGIVALPYLPSARVALAVTLDADGIERLPEPETREFLGRRVPHLRLAPFEASAPMKLLLALAGAS